MRKLAPLFLRCCRQAAFWIQRASLEQLSGIGCHVAGRPRSLLGAPTATVFLAEQIATLVVAISHKHIPFADPCRKGKRCPVFHRTRSLGFYRFRCEWLIYYQFQVRVSVFAIKGLAFSRAILPRVSFFCSR